MDKLQLALLTQWAQESGLNGIQGRKRLQKVVYFLKQVGCPIEADFILHHFGPYSRDVAQATDLMVSEGLLDEHGGSGGQYFYMLNTRTPSLIHQALNQGDSAISHFLSFRDRAISLLKSELWRLELGSTILYFFRRSEEQGWSAALREACRYKNVQADECDSREALELAQQFA